MSEPADRGYIVHVSTVYPNGDMHIQSWAVPYEVADQIFQAIPTDEPKLIDVIMPKPTAGEQQKLRDAVGPHLIGDV